MIVVDTNVVAYLLLRGDKTPQARLALQKDPVWVSSVLWRSEFRNVLAVYMRQERLTLDDARQLMKEAELLLEGREHQVESQEVLSLVASSKYSAYDCEFVALARQLGVRLVTTDTEVLSEFPTTAIALGDFVSQP